MAMVGNLGNQFLDITKLENFYGDIGQRESVNGAKLHMAL